jgi:hypothetical protein
MIIVGGGISGLFLAYKLKDTKQDILVLEKESELGGRVHTIYKTDYHYECASARFSNKHSKLITLIHELGLKDQIVKLPEKIDVIIHNKKNNINLNDLFKQLLTKTKGLKKDYLENILFFQLLIDIFDYDTAVTIREAFGYDSEFMNLNAKACIDMFKKDLFKGGSEYFTLKDGLSKIISTLNDKLKSYKNITIKLSEGLEKIEDSYISTDKKNRMYYDKLILTIPQENLKPIEYLKDVKHLDSVEGIPLLRIYFKYPVSKEDVWFKNMPRTTTDNYLRQIIPINYDNGLIMISYTDGLSTKLLSSLHERGKDVLIKAIHKEITDIFSLKETIPEPEEVFFHYWGDGCHFWKLGSDMHEIYDKMLKPIEGKELYLCGESYCKRQAWIEGSLESCYDVISKMKFKDITFKVKKVKGNKELKNYTIDEVLKNNKNSKYKWIILEIEGERRVYDVTKWIDKHPGGKDNIYKGIDANTFYDDGKGVSPISLFNGIGKHKSGNVMENMLLKKNKLVKHIGFLI